MIGSPSNRPHVLSVRTEPLPTSTQELLIYARDWFGPSYVFTELWRANGIEIYLDESNEADSTEKPAVPYQSDNYWESGHSVGGNHRPRAVDNQELLKLHLDDASHPFQPELKETHVLIKPRATAKLKGMLILIGLL